MATATEDLRVEDGAKRVRVMLGGEVVADSVHPKLVWEIPYYPAYYLPAADVRTDLLAENGNTEETSNRGEARYFDVRAGDRVAADGAWHHPESPTEEIRDHIRFDWAAMDAIFEEDEPVYVHPRDPYSRVDVLPSSRSVRVEIDGVTVAETTNPTILFETGLPPRYYMPKTDVRMDLLSPTDTTTKCPYKGTAEYYSVDVDGTTHDDVVWWYRHPTHESAGIAGLVSFYNEKVQLFVDGEPVERPETAFS